MTQRLIFLALLLGLVLSTPTPAGAAGDGLKKLKAALDKLAQVPADASPAPDDARLTDARSAIEAVAQQGDVEGARALLGLLVTPFPNATVEVFVAEHARDGLVAMEAGAGRDEVRGQLEKKKRDPRLIVPLAEVISAWSEEASVRVLADLLAQRDERQVVAGARGLARLRRKECIRPLISAFGNLQAAGGEPFEAVGSALLTLTGQGFRTAQDWTKWWETNEATWDPSQRNAAGGATRTRPFQPDAPSMFESMTIRSKKVVIVLDISGSMHIRNYVLDPIEEAPPPRGRDQGGDGSRTREGEDAPQSGPKPQQGAPLPPGVDPDAPGYKKKPCTFNQCPGARGTGPECPSDENLPNWYRRHDRLMRQVSAVIRAFKPDVKFNMVAFSSDARPWKPNALQPANDRNKQEALRWVEALQPSGATLAEKAMELAFKYEEADTIIFVTDGAPTNPAGRPYDQTRWRDLLDEVKRLNKTRKVTIDVIAIAEGHTDFARGLARENNGTYVTVP
ncbi:MAG: VWA domain-containing protein [Planctomycetes bacterium]|nr:VWA domain-containing protein [Planctomycetota bacterium]